MAFSTNNLQQDQKLGLFSIRNRLFLAFILAVALPVLVTLFIALNTTRTELTELIDADLEAISETHALVISEQLQAQIDALSLLASSQEVRSVLAVANQEYPQTQAEINEQLNANEALWLQISNGEIEENTAFRRIYEGDLTNTLLAEFQNAFVGHQEIILTDRYGGTVASTIRTSDYIQSDEDWWLFANNSGLGQIYIGNEVFFDDTTQTNGIRISVPVRHPETGDVIGVLRTHYELNIILNALDNLSFRETGADILINANGDVIAQDRSVPENFVAPSVATLSQYQENGDLFGNTVAADGRDYIIKSATLTTDGDLSVVDDLGWQIVIIQQADEALRPIIAARTATLIAAGVILILGVALASFVSIRITRPLTALSDVATRIGRDGDWDTQVEVAGNNEFGRLGAAFNAMTGELKTVFSDLEGRVQERTSDLATSAEIAAAANQIRDRDELISLTVNLIRDRFDFYYVQAYLIDTNKEFAVLSDGTGYAGRRLLARNHRLLLDSQSLVANTIKNGTATVVQDTVNDPNWLPNELLPDTKSEIVIPLQSQNEIIGVLDIQHDVVNAFDENQQQLFQTLADQLSITFENVNLLADTSERARRLAAVSEVAIEATTERDITKMLRTASQLTRDNFGLYHAHVYLTDDNSNRLKLVAGAGEAGQMMVANQHAISLENDNSIVVQSVRSYESVIVNDITLSDTFLPNPLLPNTRAEMAIPMIVAGRVVGVLDVQDDEVASFTNDDAQVLQILAAQLGVAVDNAQTLQRSQENQRFLQTVTDSTPDWIFVKDQNHRFTFVNEAFANAMNIPVEDFIGKDDAELGFSEETDLDTPVKNVMGSRADDDKVLKEGELVHNLRDIAIDAHGNTLILDTSKLPMYDNEGNIMGVFGIARDVTERNKQEQEALRRANKMQAITDISSQIVGLFDIEELLWAVSDLTAEKLRHYNVQIYLVSRDKKHLVLQASSGDAGRQMVQNKYVVNLNAPHIAAQAATERKTIVVNDISTFEGYTPNPLLPHTQSELVVPLIYGDELFGVINILDSAKDAYDDLEIQIKQTLANQVAISIQNARQFELTQTRLQEVLTLNAVADFVREIPDVEMMLESVLTISHNSLNATNTVFSYYDQEKDEWQGFVGAGVGVDSATAKTFVDAGERYPHGLEAIRTKEVVVVENVLEYENFPMDFVEILKLKSVLVVPIIVNDVAVGVMFLNYTEEIHEFTEDNLRLAITIGNQVSSGIEKLEADTQLFQQTSLAQRRASELETVANVSVATTTLLDVDELLQSVVDLTKQNFDFYHAHIYLYNEGSQNLVLAAGAGEAGRLMKEYGHQLPNDGSGLVARAARSNQVVVVNDIQAVPDFLPNPLLPETQSEMAIPLRLGDELLGVMDIQSNFKNRFDVEDIRIQSTLASQISIAIRNAQAFEREHRTIERLREVDRLKQEFLANMSHELRTPLNSIIGYSEVLLDGIDGDLTEDAIEDVDAIYTSGKHLLSIINEILDLAKIDAGQMSLNRQEQNLVDILQHIVTSSQVLVKGKEVEILLEEASPIPIAYFDSVRMNQIMLNLVSNAIKFTENGSVTVRYGMKNEDYLFIEVVDTGMGMNAEQLALIFQRFRQVDGSSTRRAGGTGLGLTITKQLVEMHGGEVGVSSEVNEGSIFFFTLPTIELAKQLKESQRNAQALDALSEPVMGD